MICGVVIVLGDVGGMMLVVMTMMMMMMTDAPARSSLGLWGFKL
jgi:hypothetical protein